MRRRLALLGLGAAARPAVHRVMTARFSTEFEPFDPTAGETLARRAERFAEAWLSCRITADGQLDFFGDEPLSPGEMP